MSVKEKPCTHVVLEVTKKDFPFSCPLPSERVWDGHPRIYLPIEVTGYTECPYCETKYTLK